MYQLSPAKSSSLQARAHHITGTPKSHSVPVTSYDVIKYADVAYMFKRVGDTCRDGRHAYLSFWGCVVSIQARSCIEMGFPSFFNHTQRVEWPVSPRWRKMSDLQFLGRCNFGLIRAANYGVSKVGLRIRFSNTNKIFFYFLLIMYKKYAINCRYSFLPVIKFQTR